MWQRRAGVILICLAVVCFQGCASLQKRRASVADSPLHRNAPEPTNHLYKAKDVVSKAGKTTVIAIVGGMLMLGAGAQKLGFGFDKDKDKDESQGFDPDQLWRSGYGYNNPNSERGRLNQPALNFDGSVAD